MRHGKKVNHLGRKKAHRDAMLSNMAASLILHKRISTTVAKAKALRKYVEPLINRSKEDTTHSRRIVFKYLGNKEAVKELFQEVSTKIGERPGGYTRILKTAYRLGDNAEMCIMELVDYNTNYTQQAEEKTGRKRRRTRRGGTSTAATTTESNQPTEASVMEEQSNPDEVTNKKENQISDVSTEEKIDSQEDNNENK